MSAGRPSLHGINQLPVVQDSNFAAPKSSPYLTAVDARDVMSKSSGSTDASSQDCLHNLISVGGQAGISGVTEEGSKVSGTIAMIGQPVAVLKEGHVAS